MVRANLNGKVEIFLKDPILMIRGTATVNCTGQMEQFIKANGSLEFNMEWENFGFLMANIKKDCLRIINSLALLKMEKRVCHHLPYPENRPKIH